MKYRAETETAVSALKPVAKQIRMKNNKTLILYAMIFFAGLMVVLYPTLSNLWNEYRNETAITEYENIVKSQQDISQMIEDAKLYNHNLTPKKIPDAFSVREGTQDKIYEKLLDPAGNGIMGYIDVPAINVKLPIYHYTNENVLKKGAGHLFGSDLPVGGKGTHAVIVAHRGLPSAELFSNLNLLKRKDQFYLRILDKTLAYEVDKISVVKPTETECLQKDSENDYVTLLTCTPYGVNSHRLLVRGHRIKYTGEDQEKANRKDISRIILIILFIAAGVIIALIILRLIDRIGRKKQKYTETK